MTRWYAARLALALVVFATIVLTVAAPARACDVCAIYTATELQATRVGIRLGIAEQFSRFKTGIPDAAGHPVDMGERLNGSTTQVLLGWDPSALFGFQVNLPIITRSYRRIEDGVLVDGRIQDGILVSGSETGIGDMSLVGLLRPWSFVDEHSVVRFTLLGGLKFPTGDPSRLHEEVEARERAQAGATLLAGDGLAIGREAHHIPAGSPSGINGHDLALGSGSWDGVLGFTGYGSLNRFFLTTSAVYSLRTEGAYDYQYGNELNWFITAGGYLLLEHDYTLALQFVNSGVYQNPDTLDGTSTAAEGEDDSPRFWVFIGPGMTFTWGSTFSAEVAADLPVAKDNVGLIPEYRIRGGLAYRF